MIESHDPTQILTACIEASIETQQKTLSQCAPAIHGIAVAIADAMERGDKLLICGNGGSAADAQHVAGEFVGRFLKNRRPLPAIALHADTSVMTCIGNDFGFDEVFARPVEALAMPGDIVVGISTSGNSPNIVKALEAARNRQAIAIGFTGASGGKVREIADACLCIPSTVTARIQETQIVVWHAICQYVDARLFPEE